MTKHLKEKPQASMLEINQATYELQKYEDLKSEKATLQNRLNSLAHYLLPRKYNIDINGENTTTDLPTDVYDGTAIYSNKVLAGGLASFLTNPTSKWFILANVNNSNKKNHKLWVQSLQRAVYRLFSESNFYQAIAELYKTTGVFGTGLFYSQNDDILGKFYQTFDIMNCMLETNEKNVVIGVYRELYYTPLQCYKAFGERLPKEIVDALKNNKRDKYKILHVVRPRQKYEEGKFDILNKPISSTYYLVKTKEILKESGFDVFPYKVARFETNPNDPYGYGPAEDTLPDIKSLNQAVYDWHESVQRANNPVVVFPSDSYGAPTELMPGDLIFKQGGDPRERIETIGGHNPNINLEMLKDIRERIRQSFFVDLFFAITNETKRMSIPEVQERIAEKLNILGSVLHSLTNELLKPSVKDAIHRVIELGWVEEAPEGLNEIDIVFVGPLSRAQRNVDAGAIQQWIASIQQMAATPQLQDALYVVNAQKASRDLASIMGVPEEDIHSEEEVQEIIQKQIEAREQILQAQNMEQSAKTGETLSKIQKNVEGK